MEENDCFSMAVIMEGPLMLHMSSIDYSLKWKRSVST
jgi:hypothetical protein